MAVSMETTHRVSEYKMVNHALTFCYNKLKKSTNIYIYIVKKVLAVILNKGERVIFLSFIFYNFLWLQYSIFNFYVNHSGEESIYNC